MASVKYVNGTSKTTKATTWNVEKLGNSTVFKIETKSSQKAKISFAGNTWEIDKYYLSLPKALSVKEINYLLSKVSPADLIVNASISISYNTQLEALRKECENITLTSFREYVWRTEYDKIIKKFDAEQIELIADTNSLIFPFGWELTPIYNSIELNGASISVNRGERVFVLQAL